MSSSEKCYDEIKQADQRVTDELLLDLRLKKI